MKKMLARLAIFGSSVSTFVVSALASNDLTGSDPYGSGTSDINVVQSDFKDAVVKGINYFLTFLGLLVVAMIIYAGVLFVTAQGDEKQIEKAKKMIMWSIVGMIVIMFSFAIVKVVAGVQTAVQ